MQGTQLPTFRPTVWPAQPPDLPGVPAPPATVVPPDGDGALELLRYDTADMERPWRQLPADFVLREVLAAELDAEGIAAFEAEWGRLPKGLNLLPWQEAEYAPVEIRQALDGLVRPNLALVYVARWHLRLMQTISRHWLSYATNDGQDLADIWEAGEFRRPDNEAQAWWFWQDHMNAALAPFRMHVRLAETNHHLVQLPQPTVYSVAALQLAQLIAEGHPVRVCANERCSNRFTRQRGRARYSVASHGYDTQKYHGVKFCSHRCAKAQSERGRRARKRKERNR
ncbi:MAG: hypothetical protein M3042_12155 [Actinomycetota bacterium]|nr:hypothetical protein [Actinomycetota bacterium]